MKKWTVHRINNITIYSKFSVLRPSSENISYWLTMTQTKFTLILRVPYQKDNHNCFIWKKNAPKKVERGPWGLWLAKISSSIGQNFIVAIQPTKKCPHVAHPHVFSFLSSAYVVSPGPTSRKFFLSVFLSVFLSFCIRFLGFQLVKALVSGSGSGIPLNQDIEPSKLRAQLSHATLRFLDWLSSATLKIFISGVLSRILMR